MTSRPLQDKVALITGASRGIGRATAVELARRGAAVALWARSTDASPSRIPGTIEEAAREVEAEGGRALAVPVDVRDEKAVHRAVEETLAAFGRIDVLVNNAAYFRTTPLGEIDPNAWRLTMDVNVLGAALCVQAALPAMIEQGSGRIINVSSGAAAQSHPNMWAYGASKAALEALTLYTAGELASKGIAANALRIDVAVATEGARFLNPDGDFDGWASSGDAARGIAWLAEQPVSYTGNIVPMSEIVASNLS
jgi:NAD(P)-dependent dehydrogenase (short-subunit alcohol dehydrogenase family)